MTQLPLFQVALLVLALLALSSSASAFPKFSRSVASVPDTEAHMQAASDHVLLLPREEMKVPHGKLDTSLDKQRLPRASKSYLDKVYKEKLRTYIKRPLTRPPRPFPYNTGKYSSKNLLKRFLSGIVHLVASPSIARRVDEILNKPSSLLGRR